MTLDLDELERKAKAWNASRVSGLDGGPLFHVAMVDPATILSLISELRAARAEREELIKQRDDLRTLNATHRGDNFELRECLRLLMKLANHHPDCKWFGNITQVCTCGFHKLHARIRRALGEGTAAEAKERANVKIQLQQAFAWTCPWCSTKNYLDGVTPALSPDEREEAIKKFADLEPWQELPGDHGIELVAAPESVRCINCERSFQVEGEPRP